MFGFLIPAGGGDPIPLSKKEMTVGRHKSCDIFLNYSNVSGKHCKLVLSEGYWYILDLQSTNGVKVNGEKVTDRRVDPGTTLAISKHIFKLQYDPRQNGASGLPPSNMLKGEDILSQSLMERAGLQKPKEAEEPEPAEEVKPEPVQPAADFSTAVKLPRRDFFSELKFD